MGQLRFYITDSKSNELLYVSKYEYSSEADARFAANEIIRHLEFINATIEIY